MLPEAPPILDQYSMIFEVYLRKAEQLRHIVLHAGEETHVPDLSRIGILRTINVYLGQILITTNSMVTFECLLAKKKTTHKSNLT